MSIWGFILLSLLVAMTWRGSNDEVDEVRSNSKGLTQNPGIMVLQSINHCASMR